MIDFENADAIPCLPAIRVCIQPGPENHELTRSALDGGSQGIFREARPHGDEDPHSSTGGVELGVARDGVEVFTEYSRRKRIGEYPAAFENLMRGAMTGRGQSRPAGFSGLHTSASLRNPPPRATPEILSTST